MNDDHADAIYGSPADTAPTDDPNEPLVLTNPEPVADPTVGRIVHYYDESLGAGAFNSMGKGPYAAVVVQAFGGPFANLLVTPPFEGAFHVGSAAHRDSPARCGSPRYWVWPPRG